jgi:4,5-dihydroxyphthalate decarboxylase
MMAKLVLSVAVGDYDRTRPLVDGTVQIDGTDPVFMLLEPEEIFFRAFAMPSSTSASCRFPASR